MEYLKSLKIDKFYKLVGVLRNSLSSEKFTCKAKANSQLIYVYGNGNNGKTTFFRFLEDTYKDKITRLPDPVNHADIMMNSEHSIYLCEDLFHGEMKICLDPLMKVLDECDRNGRNVCLVVLSNVPLAENHINHLNEAKFTYCQFQNTFTNVPWPDKNKINLAPIFTKK